MIKIRTHQLLGVDVYDILVRHINNGIRLHSMLYLTFKFRIFDKDSHDVGRLVAKCTQYRSYAKIPEDIGTDKLVAAICSLLDKINDDRTCYDLTIEEMMLVRRVYEFEMEMISKGLLPWHREIPEREAIIQRFHAQYGDDIADRMEALSAYEDVRCYLDIIAL